MVLKATPTGNNLPLRAADFPNLAAALDYAALGRTGSNFYNGRGELYAVVSYAELRNQALELADTILSRTEAPSTLLLFTDNLDQQEASLLRKFADDSDQYSAKANRDCLGDQ